MNDHQLRVTRYQRGRSVIAGPSGTFYGTMGRCSCGEWVVRVNVAPSKGGRREVERDFRAHLAGSISSDDALPVVAL